MAKEVYFFLTKEEMLNVFEQVECVFNLKYIKAKGYHSTIIQEFSFIKEIDELGKNKSGNHQSNSFLVMERNNTLFVRSVEQTDGKILHFVDQMNNEKSVIFWPSGIYENKFFVCGHLGANDNELSNKLFVCIRKKILKQCDIRVGRYYVGKEAQKLYNDLRFITINIEQPEEYDIKL